MSCAQKPCGGRRHDLDWGWCTKKVRPRWYQHFSSSSIAQRAVCHSCKVLQSTMKRTKESGMDRQAKLFSFGFSRGRSGNQAEPNGLTLLLVVHLSRFESLRPRKSRQAVRSKKNNTLEVIMWLRPVLLSSRVRHRALTCKERCGRGRLRFRQARTSEERKQSYRQELRLSEALSERLPATVQGKMAGREMAYVLRIGGRRFLCTMRSVSKKSWSRCWAVDHEAYDQLDKRFNNPEGARCQQNAQSVRDAAQLQNEDPSVAQLRRSSSTKRPRYLSKQSET